MFKRIRIAILLYILLFVAVGQFLASHRASNWDDTLWIDVYPINGEGSKATQRYIDSLTPDAFEAVERFFADEARRHGLGLEQPFRIQVADQLENDLPPVPDGGGMLATIVWSLKMRWLATRLHVGDDRPTPDITVFAVYFDAEDGVSLDRSTALRKGMIGIANLFGARSADGSNQMIIAHEILHTLGASDKYDLATGLPAYPLGFADPARSPLYPQSSAELMAGRIPIARDKAIVPKSLNHVVIGPVTALEIGWTPAGQSTE